MKLLLALVAGIMLQWSFPAAVQLWLSIFITALFLLFSLFFIPFFHRYRYAFFNGIIASFLFIALGALLVYQKDIRNHSNWLGNYYNEKDGLIVTLNEPLVEKIRSVKAIATVRSLLKNGKIIPEKGKIILYFSKDVIDHPSDSMPKLSYGSTILFSKPLQEIRNAGNPGSFDYKRYCLFQGITHQVYLKPGDFEMMQNNDRDPLMQFIYSSREKLLKILGSNIRSEKELGLAEALLIGYKDDLDRSLVQSYTNTGVVHIIAISGLHLGLIYWLLALALKPLKKIKKLRWLRALLIITGLWLFSLLAGAQPSILRSALMFTCIVLGESLSKKTSIYNTMALSAFILLCINPFWLWDVGFQLSYSAVLSIIIFMRPIYNWFYIENKILDTIWKLNAVTLAAQVLTVPLSIYHFHQFPNLFILTNFIAVPLSSLILLGEILLCVISFFPAAAIIVGKLVTLLIRLMNTYIERIESIPFSLWDGLQISFTQMILLFAFAIGCSYWLMERSVRWFQVGLLSLLLFFTFRSLSFLQTQQQQKIIVYNIPRQKAIDIIDGRDYVFTGDSSLIADDFARNFHLKPSRTLNRLMKVDTMDRLKLLNNYLSFDGKHILLLDKPLFFLSQPAKLRVDLLIISSNKKINIKKLATALNIKEVVFDGSVPAWRSRYYKQDCDSLHIRWYDITMKGAFVMNLR